MSIGQVPVQLMCAVTDGFKLHVEDVDGVDVPKMSMSFSVKMSFPIHELLKTLASWQAHHMESFRKDDGESSGSKQEACKTRKVDGESSGKQEAFKAAPTPAPLRNSPSYPPYEAQNRWERVDCPKVVLLANETKLQEATFSPLRFAKPSPMSYAEFRGQMGSEPTVAGLGLGQSPKAPPETKAPPPGWRTPPAPAKPVSAVQHKVPPAWQI